MQLEKPQRVCGDSARQTEMIRQLGDNPKPHSYVFTDMSGEMAFQHVTASLRSSYSCYGKDDFGTTEACHTARPAQADAP